LAAFFLVDLSGFVVFLTGMFASGGMAWLEPLALASPRL